MKIIDAKIQHDLDNGIIVGEEVSYSKKLYKDAKEFYQSEADLSDDSIMYEVYSYIGGEESGSLNYGLTVLQPIKVNGECNMTRGHFHFKLNDDEIYVGLAGEGLLMYMNKEGECWCEKVKRGSVHYINGNYAHRLINTGEEIMKVQCFWPSDAGHDYQQIEEHPFTTRVFKENGEVIFK